MDNPKYLDLMSKYLSGNISPAERKDLLQWAESSESNKAFFDEMIQLWSLSGDYEEEEFYPVDVNAAWDNLEPRLDNGGLKEFSGGDILPNQAEDIQAPPNAPGRIVPFYYRRRNWSIAAAIALIVAVGAFIFPQVVPPANTNIATLEGERKDVLLPDGTKIVLNANSTLIYPSKFEKRSVKLVGEAYFDVASIKDRPFTIQSGDIITTVVGTAFNIRAYPEEAEVEVFVEEGIVRVEAPEAIAKTENNPDATSAIEDAFALTLTQGQSAAYDQMEQSLQSTEEEMEIAIAWKDRVLVFNETPLPKVAEQLERYFGVEFIITEEEKLQDFPVIYPLTKDPELENVLEIVQEMMLGLKIEKISDRTYRIECNDCD